MAKTGWKPGRIAVLLAAAALAAIPAATGTRAADLTRGAGGIEAAPGVHVYQDWELACPTAGKPEKDASCKVEEDILDAATHDTLAQIMISHVKGKDVMHIMLPHDTLLDPGIALGFDDAKPLLFNFETCDAVGCLVVIPFAGALAEKFAAAIHPRILFAGLDSKPVGLTYSMLGFSDALKAYRQAERKLAKR